MTFRQRRAPYILLALALTALLVAAIGVIWHTRTPHPSRTVVPGPAATTPDWTPSSPAVPSDVHTAWAYLDSTEGDMQFGGDLDPHPLDQLVVPGLAADYLDTLDHGNRSITPHDTVMLAAALTGNTEAATQLANTGAGPDTVFQRVAAACSMTEATAGPPAAPALDAARYGACLREGGIAGPDASAWVLNQMRNNPGGIGDVRGNDGGQRLAQFNSTAPAGPGRMRTGCLGVGAYWSAAVFVDWPAGRGDLYGVAVCAEVAAAQFPPDTQTAPDSPAPSEQRSA